MKKLINQFKGLLAFAFMLAPFLSIAADGNQIEKKRTISKTYSVGADDRLFIDNSFGNIVVSTWDKNEIQVDIEIGVHASSDENADQMMNQISVTDHQGGKEISFKTNIGRMSKNKNNDNGENRKFYIDYKISMPSNNALDIKNSFGKINMPDFAGVTNLTSSFGELTTGKIPNAKLIHVEFGKADIGRLNNAEVVFKFNNNSNIAGLSGNAKVDVQFCSHVDLIIDDAVKDFSLYESYSTVNLKVSSSLSAQFNVYTNFGSFKNKTDYNIEAEKEDDNSGPKFDKNYSGSAGGGSSKIKIKSSFGTIRLTNISDKNSEKENADNDEKDNDAEKAKVDM
jgi:hypothetical protein